MEKDDDWYIYPKRLAYDSPKNAQKSSKNFKASIHDVVRKRRKYGFAFAYCYARFARYCGKMFSRHVFPYG